MNIWSENHPLWHKHVNNKMNFICNQIHVLLESLIGQGITMATGGGHHLDEHRLHLRGHFLG